MLYFYNMSNDDDRIFKALASALRRAMLDVLRNGPRTTGDLCREFPQLGRCTVMQHLTVLTKAGLVVVERRGRERWNTLDALPIKAIHDRWIHPYATEAVGLLQHLAEALDDTAAPASATMAPPVHN